MLWETLSHCKQEQKGDEEEKNQILNTKHTSVEENHRKLICLLPE